MKQLFLSIFPRELRRNAAYWRGVTLGFIIVLLVIFQLFTFEDFPAIVQGWGLPGGRVLAYVLAGLLPFLGVASLPFLLSMRLPLWLWRFSRVCLLLLGTVWLSIAVWCNVTHLSIESGLFGATLPLMTGWWTVLFAGLLLASGVVVVRELPRRK